MNEVDTSTERKIRTAQTIRIVVWVVVAAAIVVFAALNTDEVTVDWGFGEAETSLWIVIGVSAVAGALLGAIVRRRS